MAINFPSNPNPGDSYTFNNITWVWNGYAWDKTEVAGISGSYVSKLNGLSGGVTLAAGSNITLTPSGNIITVASTGSGTTGATGATGATGSTGSTGATGATGATPTNYVISFNGFTGAVTGVNSIRGLTGTIGITNGSGISLSVSGQTLTISHLVTNEDTNATRYIGFYGSTSGTDTPRTDIGLRYNPFTQTISGMGGLVLSGISSGGAASNNSISLYDPNISNMIITSSTGNVNFTTPTAVAGDVASISLLSQDGLENGYTAKIVPQTFYSATRTFTLPDDSGTVALTKNLVSSFNGRTGSVQGVSAAVAGTGISVSGATGSVTITNTGVQSFNGSTGAVTGVASFNGSTGAVTFNAYVSSFNGLTGAVTGVTTGTANTFVALQSFTTGISASGGVTFGGTLQGTTANFTGLVSSTVGFSGAATNLVGNASGLTAGTASRVQIAEGAGSSYYLALAGGVGNTGIFVDTSIPRWNYNASTGSLTTSTGYVEAAYLYANTAVYSNSIDAYDSSSAIFINTPNFDGTSQAINIGDYNDAGNGTIFTLDDANTKIEINAVDVDCFANMNVRGGSDLRFYVPGGFTYIGFKSPLTPPNNIIWTLPSADGSLNQVLTTNGSGTLSWSTPTSGLTAYVSSFNGKTGAVQGVSAAVAGSGISVSGATGTVTITNSGVTGIRGGTGISVSSTTGYPTIGVTLASGQSFIGADVNLTTASTWYNVTGLTLDVGTWFVTGNLTCIRGGSGTRVFSIQLVDTTPTTYASAAQGLASVSGNSVQIACSAIITFATSKRINLQGMTSTTATDVAAYLEPQLGAINASGIVAFRIA